MQTLKADDLRSVFNDFGRDFACVDTTGENPQSGMIVHVEEVGVLIWYFAMH